MLCNIVVPPDVADVQVNGKPLEQLLATVSERQAMNNPGPMKMHELHTGNADFMNSNSQVAEAAASVETLLASTSDNDSDSDGLESKTTDGYIVKELIPSFSDFPDIGDVSLCALMYGLPMDAVGMHWKLPPQRIQDICKEDSIFPIIMSCVSALWSRAKQRDSFEIGVQSFFFCFFFLRRCSLRVSSGSTLCHRSTPRIL